MYHTIIFTRYNLFPPKKQNWHRHVWIKTFNIYILITVRKKKPNQSCKQIIQNIANTSTENKQLALIFIYTHMETKLKSLKKNINQRNSYAMPYQIIAKF